MVINFGKYAGKEVKELPTDYLEWGVNNLTIDYVKDAFQKELNFRTVDTQLDYNVPKDNINKLVFGKDETTKIVNVTMDNDKVYIYQQDGSSFCQEYYPWVLSNVPSSKREAIKLKGSQYYKYLTHMTTEDYINVTKLRPRGIWFARSIEESFMLREGVTYFKDLKPSELKLLSFDIEATGVDPEADDAEVILISSTFRDSNGSTKKVMFDISNYDSDGDMIDDWTDWVREQNPDVMLGHNIFGYDLNYLHKRSKNGLKIGRDGSVLRFDDKVSKFRKDGSQQYDYINAKCHGRELICTMFLSIKYDIGRDFPSYGLKQIEKHLKLVDENRTSWNFDEYKTRDYKKWTKEKWQEFIKYCEGDSDSPIQIFDKMIPSFFYLNRSVPKTLQQIINEASGSQLDSIMIRSYLQDDYSQPKTSQKVEYEGAISMGNPGLYRNVIKVDVASLYPSIMLEKDIYDRKKDPNRHMLQILEYFREERLNNKHLAEETQDKYYDDIQGAQKIVINSMYGFMGAGFLLYNYPEGAKRVCERGQEILQDGVRWACGHELVKEIKKTVNKGKANEEHKYHWICGPQITEGKGYTLVNVDTDSFSVTNGEPFTKAEFKEFINELNEIYSDYIKWEDDGLYTKVLVVASKNYVLEKHPDWCKAKDLNKDGTVKLKFKGSSLTDQKKEPMLARLSQEIIHAVLEGKQESDLVNIYNKYCLKALNPENIRDWCIKKTITKPILECAKNKNEARANEYKPYQACVEAIEKGVIPAIQEGDKIYLYQTIDGMKPKIVRGAPQLKKDGTPIMVENNVYRFPELYNNDHDKYHYVKRVYATLSILENIINMDNFIKYFNKGNRKKLDELV
jgi:DNA polymerase, archaea type